MSKGDHAEAARAFEEALNASLAAAELLDEPTPRPHVERARLALGERDHADLTTFLSDAAAAHQALYEEVAPYALDVRTLRRAQIRRAAAIIAITFGMILFAGWYIRGPSELRAEASAVYSAQFLPFRAVDGEITSEWLLPDRTTGWIELTISAPRKVKKVRLMNARNVPYNDRATNAFRVEAFYEGQVLSSGEGSFNGFSPNPNWREIELDGRRADKIKVWVNSFTEAGGGFAEITIE